MNSCKSFKWISLSLVYGINLLLAIALWLCGLSGNIMIGIFLIAFYRLSLWFSPLAVTVIAWIPPKSEVPISKKLLHNLLYLLICGVQFLICFLVFGNWY